MLLCSSTRDNEPSLRICLPVFYECASLRGSFSRFALSVVALLFASAAHIWRSESVQNHSRAAKHCLQELYRCYPILREGRSKAVDNFQPLVDVMSDMQANAQVRDSEFSRRLFSRCSSSVMTTVRVSQSQSYFTTDGQSVSISWCRAPLWGP
jgi:hypothetical protein